MTYGEQDLDTMLFEFGVPVVFIKDGIATTGSGIVDEDDEQLQTGEAGFAAGLVKVLTIKTEHFPDVAAGLPITVDGSDFRISYTRRQGDGALTRIWLARTT